ncbi:hypothetical protein NIB75_10965 [Bacteroides uniformis]|nr:hypothetical protein [Bacteroides uniformis]
MGRNSLQRNKAKVTNTTGCIMILKIPPNVPHTNTNAISAIDTIPDMANIWLISGNHLLDCHRIGQPCRSQCKYAGNDRKQ